MPLTESHTVDYVSWARRANARWIVHGGLSTDAESYMTHLEQSDKNRFHLSCRNAYLMVWQRDSREDPKPWFYSGLFSLATADERERFIAGHWLTNIMVMHSQKIPCEDLSPSICDLTKEKIQRLREAMAKLPDSL